MTPFELLLVPAKGATRKKLEVAAGWRWELFVEKKPDCRTHSYSYRLVERTPRVFVSQRCCFKRKNYLIDSYIDPLKLAEHGWFPICSRRHPAVRWQRCFHRWHTAGLLNLFLYIPGSSILRCIHRLLCFSTRMRREAAFSRREHDAENSSSNSVWDFGPADVCRDLCSFLCCFGMQGGCDLADRFCVLRWLLAQRRGTVTISDVAHRWHLKLCFLQPYTARWRAVWIEKDARNWHQQGDDCTEVHVPENCKGWVTGTRAMKRVVFFPFVQCKS